MNTQAAVLLRPETLTLRDRPVRVVPPEEVIDSEALLKGRREILIQHGDRFYRLRHTCLFTHLRRRRCQASQDSPR